MRALLSLFVLGACSTAASEPRAKGPQGPLILELFTSQGCSSCPPADVILAKLTSNPDVEPLSFHVDYWNDLGWADPYSKPAWTARQHQYASALGDTRVYTPELVIGGKVGLVGSHAIRVKEAIAGAERPALLDAKATWTADSVEITATAPPDAEVLVALWESERTIKVTRGENTGRALSNAHIVRKLERVAAPGKRGTLTVKLDAGWRSVGAVAFAQRADKRIIASARLLR